MWLLATTVWYSSNDYDLSRRPCTGEHASVLGGQIVNSGTVGDVDSIVGVGFTAVKVGGAGTGAYQITLSDAYPQVWAVTATAQSTTTDLTVVVGAITAPSSSANNKIAFAVVDSSTGAAHDLLNERLHFHLTLVRSNAQ